MLNIIMEKDNITTLVEKHKEMVSKGQPEINLVSPCRLNEGIIRHAEFEKNRFKKKFEEQQQSIEFFIPASGSGSRMFKFLYEFLADPNEASRSKTERFLNAIESFAFFELLPYAIKKKVRDYDISLDDFVSYLLKNEGLGLGLIPKGLVPFHRSRSFILNAFQEQLLQGLRLKEDHVNFHFTINKSHEEEINASLKSIQQLTGRKCAIKCTEQDPSTHSIAFDKKMNTITDDKGDLLVRPSGHGALLKNLNTLSSDIVFIKNIDNIQHESRADVSIDNLKYLGGMLSIIKNELKEAIQDKDSRNKLAALNLQYQFAHPKTDFSQLSEEAIKEMIYRPIRICGMVRNEGQPGGGPFWVEEEGQLSKQIVEKSQIGKDESQYRLMVQSQYFNPVIMAVSTKDIDGVQLDLNHFSDPKKYFIVEKSYKNKDIRFVERPGLWNGSMAKWLSIFVEVPSETFTPVKTVLDLLDPAHREM
ncbi:hypothetical protein CW751_00190 [Brumimicrobium salinarum]|uniref:DUF4301 domain-containing protein n=1 Tax=Brumimicrobium salinarum TaxID=2058658 RepID=A0A2I0R5G1_9FLAO|nr:DUF4301 family protein [Brumimicrobium salinarum]PKR81795.1 hypothetical protein CW751_00190 [Brumimicrobium salinarum]